MAFIPVFTLLMSGFACGEHSAVHFWYEAGVECHSLGYLVQSAISVVLTAGFVALCSLFSLVFYDSNSMSPNIVAKAHGRADLCFLCVKTVLVVFVDTFPSVMPTPALAAVVALCGAAWVGSLLYFMPFFDHRWNRFHLAQASSRGARRAGAEARAVCALSP